MKTRFFVLALSALMLAAPSGVAAPRAKKKVPKTATKPASSPAKVQAAYAAKIRSIEDRLTVPLVEIVTANAETEKSAIMAKRAGVEKALADLRAISPVPKSLASVDATYGHFSQEASSALSMIFYGLEHNDFAPVIAGQSRLSDSLAIMTKADKELELKTAPAQQGKKYVDG